MYRAFHSLLGACSLAQFLEKPRTATHFRLGTHLAGDITPTQVFRLKAEASHSTPSRFLGPWVHAERNPRCARSLTPKSLQPIYLSSYDISMPVSSMKGDASMTQEFIVLLLVGLVGVIWVIVLDIRGDKHHRHHKRQGNPSPEPHDGKEPREHSSRQSKVAV
jgi:hypothetical protein